MVGREVMTKKTIELRVPHVSDYVVLGITSAVLAVSATVFAFTVTDGREMTEGREILCVFFTLILAGLSSASAFTANDRRQSSLHDEWIKSECTNNRLRDLLDKERDDHASTKALLKSQGVD